MHLEGAGHTVVADSSQHHESTVAAHVFFCLNGCNRFMMVFVDSSVGTFLIMAHPVDKDDKRASIVTKITAHGSMGDERNPSRHRVTAVRFDDALLSQSLRSTRGLFCR